MNELKYILVNRYQTTKFNFFYDAIKAKMKTQNVDFKEVLSLFEENDFEYATAFAQLIVGEKKIVKLSR